MSETYETHGFRCPHCYHLHRAEDPHHWDEDWTEGECERCEKPFNVRVYTSTSWTCTPAHNTTQEP